ncbi:MAG: hypothetical protein M3Z20_04035 [Chloroflexota bacterium]|nr:hypothetical protein [Chloroflexota bacterium]
MTTPVTARARPGAPLAPAWLGYEIRQLGWLSFALPCFVLLLFAGLAALEALLGAPREETARLLVAGLEMGLPYAAGIAAATVINRDPALALQLSTPTGVRRTIGRRIGLLTGWMALLALGTTLVLDVLGLWQQWAPVGLWTGQLVWLAPLTWFTGAGLVLGLVLGSQTTASALLGGLWVFTAISASVVLAVPVLRLEYLFLTTVAPDVDFWLANRVVVLVTGIGLAGVAGILSTKSELHARGEVT